MKAATLLNRGRRALTFDLAREGDRVGFVRTVSETFGTRIFGIIVGVLTLTLTTRLLGPVGRGQFAIVMATVALIVQLSNAGLPASTTYSLARRPADRLQVTGLLFWFGVTVVAAVAWGGYWLARHVPTLIESVPPASLGLGLLAAPPLMFVSLAGNAFLGLGRARWFNGLDLGVKTVGLVAVVLLVWYRLEVLLLVYAGLHYVLAAIAYLKLSGWRRPVFPDKALAKRLFSYGVRAYLVTLFMFFVLRLDLFLVNSMRGTADAGRYSVAVQVAEILNLAAASIGTIAFPHLTAQDPTKRWAIALRLARMTAAVLCIGAILVGLLARPVFLRLFGLEFLGAVHALWWLLPGLCCLGINNVLFQYLSAGGLPWFLAISTAASAVLNLALNALLIPRSGISGAAIASSIAYAFLLLITSTYLMTPSGRRYQS